MHHLLNPGGRKLFIGTPHAYDSVYPELIGKGASPLVIPLLTNIEGEFPALKGKCVWPERWNAAEIINKQLACKSRSEFFSQYQLIPMTNEDVTLDPSLLHLYDEDIDSITLGGRAQLRVAGKKVTNVSTWWDPALSSAKGDSSVLALVLLTEDGHIYVHRAYELLGDADKQCLKVKEKVVEHGLAAVKIETNGVGGFLPQVLLKHTRGMGVGVISRFTKINKADKIIEAFETPLSGGFIHVHRSVMSTKFATQLRDFNPRRMNAHDDYVDAVASAIRELPIRISAGAMNRVAGFVPFKPGDTFDLAVEPVSF